VKASLIDKWASANEQELISRTRALNAGRLSFSNERSGILPAFGPNKQGSVAMTTLKMTTLKAASPKTASRIAKHLDIRLRKIRSLKTSALQAPMIVTAAARVSHTKSSIKSIVPYSLVIASLVLSGITASEAHAAAAHAKTAKPARVVTHVVRRRAAPAQQIDPVAQFFQGLFGGAPVVRMARGRADEGDYVADSPTYDTSAPVDDGAAAEQAASDAEVQAIQQMNDENALTASMQAAEEQNDEANAATLQTEINAGM
jgi:hypothetical protein